MDASSRSARLSQVLAAASNIPDRCTREAISLLVLLVASTRPVPPAARRSVVTSAPPREAGIGVDVGGSVVSLATSRRDFRETCTL